MSQVVVETAKCGTHKITLETGRLARQAHGSVLVSQGESMVLVTAVSAPHNPAARFFPLVVDYIEKMYASGKIPGGYGRREGKLSDAEVLVSRLCDRPIRPLFPEGFLGEVQLVATVVSHDGVNDTDVLAMTGCSAALMLSSAPFAGPIAGVRVGRIGGKFVANPAVADRDKCDINIVMACSKDAIVMVEGEAKEVPEADMLAALDFGFTAVKGLLDAQVKMAKKAGKPKVEFTPPASDAALKKKIEKILGNRVVEAMAIKVKAERYGKLKELHEEVKKTLGEAYKDRASEVGTIYEEINAHALRSLVVKHKKRIDGRGLRDIRPITTEVGILPRVHGTGLFTRGETQALVTCTLGTDRDSKLQDTLTGKYEEKFMLHYNFPPFSVGEIKPMRGPGRREIGHGTLAQRGLAQVMPSYEEFPYVIRIVSEVLESNGSSSMATACGGTLAMLDAGVPLKAPVAGIAMGLVNEGKEYVVLSDILGDEDHLGDMDFKVVGTTTGVCSLQMDIKIKGLPRDVMAAALDQAREGRLHILSKMAESLSKPRPELSKYAPRITTIKISPDKIRDIIGSGGKTIRSIQERTGCSINVSDDGTVKVASSDMASTKEALRIINAITAEAVVGEIYLGIVAKVAEFGAFITILPGTDGLCHISELTEERVDRVEDIVREGDEVVVKCMGVERNGKIRLSRKEALGKEPNIRAAKFEM